MRPPRVLRLSSNPDGDRIAVSEEHRENRAHVRASALGDHIDREPAPEPTPVQAHVMCWMAACVLACLVGCSSRETPRGAGTTDADCQCDGATVPDVRVPDVREPDVRVPDVREPDVRELDAIVSDQGALDAIAPDAGVPDCGVGLDASPSVSSTPVVGSGTLFVGAQLIGTEPLTIISGSFLADAGSDASDGGAGDGRCTYRTEGECLWTMCAPPTPADGGVSDAGALDADGLHYLGAGDLVFSTGSITRTLMRLSGGFYSDSVRGPFVRDGDTVTVRAAGGEVPAFMTSVTAPTRITVTAPTLSMTTPFVVDRAAPLTVTWTGGCAGSVTVGVGGSTPGGTVGLLCTYAAAAGRALIPSALLMRIPAGAGGHVSVNSINRSTTITPAGWRIVTSVGDAPSGGFALARFD